MAKAYRSEDLDRAAAIALGEYDPEQSIATLMLMISGGLVEAVRELSRKSGATVEGVVIEAIERLAIERGVDVERIGKP